MYNFISFGPQYLLISFSFIDYITKSNIDQFQLDLLNKPSFWIKSIENVLNLLELNLSLR